jgi:hypothetical protein
MIVHRPRAVAGAGRFRLGVTAVALVAGLSALTVSLAQDVTPGTNTNPPVAATPLANPTASEIQTLNQALLVERLLAGFYNQNADKAYLTGTSAVTNPAPTSPTTTTPAADPNATPAPADPSGITQPLGPEDLEFASTLSGGAQVPAVTTSASATARFILRKDRRTVDYEIRLAGLSSAVTEIHLHQADPGQPGGIIHHALVNPENGVSTGSFGIRPEELDAFMNGRFFIEIHTQQHPTGELRGQVVAGSSTTVPPGTTVPPVSTPGTTTGSARESLRQMVIEIRDHHNAHVALLEQTLGTNAQPAQSFQNLDAPTLEQFLTMAVTLEDFAVGAHQHLIASAAGATPPATGTLEPSARVAAFLLGIALNDARHAGALRAYRKVVSTAEGGDPNLTITEGGALNVPRTADQLNQFIQPYLVVPGTTQPPVGNEPTPNPTTGNPPTL